MAKSTKRKTKAKPANDPTWPLLVQQKRTLKRKLQLERDIVRLARTLEHMSTRSKMDLLALARFVAIENGYVLVAGPRNSESQS